MKSPIAPLAALLAALSGMASAETRSLTGTVAYRERIALDPGALLLVELRGPDGAVVAEARVATDGRQVPLPFAVDAPAGTDLTLRAALVVGGRALFASPPVALAAGDAPVTLDPIGVTRFDATAFASHLRCGDTAVAVTVVADGAILRARGQTWRLAPEPAASGARYTAPGATVWSRGNTATVTLGDATLPDCRATIPPALVPLTARGNEPFWTLTLAEGRATLARVGATPAEAPLPAPGTTADGALRYTLTTGHTITLTDAIHRDTMTGMPRPVTVTVAQGDTTLTGGAGDPLALLAGAEWRAVSIGGAALPDGAEVTLTVLPDGGVSGKSACNRYAGTLALTGEGLAFGRLAGTMMACPDPLMAVERQWLDTLATVTRFDIARDGALVLLAGDTAVARLTR